MSERPKNMILTGASRGIGHATVKRFSAENWRIITCSRDAVPEACKRDPNWSDHIPTDLSDSQSVDAFVAHALDALGDEPLHALVNNAAVSPKTTFKERLGCLNGGLDGWREVFELNFFTPLILSRGFAAALTRGSKDGGASIVNIAPTTVNATDFCNATVTASAVPECLQKWTRQRLYPLSNQAFIISSRKSVRCLQRWTRYRRNVM